MTARPASVVPFDEKPSKPVKIAPRLPPKPKKKLSTTDSNGDTAYTKTMESRALKFEIYRTGNF